MLFFTILFSAPMEALQGHVVELKTVEIGQMTCPLSKIETQSF